MKEFKCSTCGSETLNKSEEELKAKGLEKDDLELLEFRCSECGSYHFTCPLCGCHEYMEMKLFEWDTEAKIDQYQCNNCSLIFGDLNKISKNVIIVR